MRVIAAIALAVAGLTAAAGCSSESGRQIIPTTRPVLTTLRPDLTTTTAAPISQRLIYTVQPGDTLGRISALLGVSVQAIMDANGKEDTILRIGEDLIIPPIDEPGSGADSGTRSGG